MPGVGKGVWVEMISKVGFVVGGIVKETIEGFRGYLVLTVGIFDFLSR